MIRYSIFFIIACILSAALMLSIPAVSILIGQKFSPKKSKQARTTTIERITLPKERLEQKSARRQPKPRPVAQQSRMTGTRFALALDVEGPGASVGIDQIDRQSSRSGEDDFGADNRPEMTGNFTLDLPPALKKAEQNASLRLLFCVDVSGKAYNIKVTDETPSGFGLGQAGIAALKQTIFKPALRQGQAVPFCGMEQPVEIKFRN
jgi:hypothetical protein